MTQIDEQTLRIQPFIFNYRGTGRTTVVTDKIGVDVVVSGRFLRMLNGQNIINQILQPRR